MKLMNTKFEIKKWSLKNPKRSDCHPESSKLLKIEIQILLIIANDKKLFQNRLAEFKTQ